MKAEIYHLYHSSAAVIINDDLFVFDYYKDDLKGKNLDLKDGVITKNSFDNINRAFVFVSHRHHDHYNKVIYKWQQYLDQIYYIISDDVEMDFIQENIIMVSKDQTLTVSDIKIKTFGSTDEGVSFLVKTPDFNIFHAGDLNWWKWKKFSHRVQKREERNYKNEIKKLSGENIDIAFVPVDPRLEENYYLAGKYFIEKIKPEVFIPIHFADNYSITEKFKKKMTESSSDVKEIKFRGENMTFEKF
ncbi:MAG: MBL fold metallo-hydrolase [Bacillota bacterium]